MNTGFLGPAVATVPTVYGIEIDDAGTISKEVTKLQQYLPFTVLKLMLRKSLVYHQISCNSTYRLRY